MKEGEVMREEYNVARIIDGESKAAIAVAGEAVDFLADCGCSFRFM